jgi:hypothetical protein
MSQEDSVSGGFQGQRRLPYAEKRIDEITQNDIKVRFVGTIIQRSGDMLMLDDGTGQVKVMSGNLRNADTSATIRVFGRVVPTADGVEISGEIIQEMVGVDMELYNSVHDAERALGV